MKEWIKCFFIGNGWVSALILCSYLAFKFVAFMLNQPIIYSGVLLAIILMAMVTISTHQAREDKRLGRTTDRPGPG